MLLGGKYLTFDHGAGIRKVGNETHIQPSYGARYVSGKYICW